jgi:hypothetical protein
MSDSSSRGGRMSRESRLLRLKVVVCAVVRQGSNDAVAADVQRVEPTIRIAHR